MAAKLTVKVNDNIESIDLESTLQPSEVMEEAVNNSETLHKIIDEDLVINDPGYLDLSQLSALQTVNPQEPGSYPQPSISVTFTEEDKNSLEAIIKKLAESCHTHSITATDTTYGSSVVANISCSHLASCSHNANNSYSSHGDNCDNAGKW